MDSSNERQIFYVGLKPGETTIVSWKKLLRGEEKKIAGFCTADTCQCHVDIPSADQTPESVTDAYSGFVKPKDKNCEFVVKSEKPESISISQKTRKRKIDVPLNEEQKTEGHLSAKHVKLQNVLVKATVENGLFLEKHSANSSTSAAKNYYPAGAQAFPSVDGNPKGSANLSRRSFRFSSPKILTRNDSSFLFGAKDTFEKKKKTKTSHAEILKKNSGISTNLPNVHQSLFRGSVTSNFSSESGKSRSNKNRLVVSFNSSQKKLNDSEAIDVSLPRCSSPSQSVTRTAFACKMPSAIKSNRNMLENAIKELGKIVAKSKSCKIENLDADASSFAIGRRIPVDVKQKLTEVASIVWSSNGIILEELVTHLVSILGPLAKGPAMKKKLRELVLLKLTSKRDQADEPHCIKNELHRMVNAKKGKKAQGRVIARPRVQPTAAEDAKSTAQEKRQASGPIFASPSRPAYTLEIKNAHLAVPARAGSNSDGYNLDFRGPESSRKTGIRLVLKDERHYNPNIKAS